MNKLVSKYMDKIKPGKGFEFEDFSRDCQKNNKSYKSPEVEQKQYQKMQSKMEMAKPDIKDDDQNQGSDNEIQKNNSHSRSNSNMPCILHFFQTSSLLLDRKKTFCNH